MSLGLVFSGGGVRGSAHIGVLKALHEANIRPQMLAGTSAGSIVAGLYAYGLMPEEIRIIANRIARYYYDLDYVGILQSLLAVFTGGNLSINGLIKGNILESVFNHVTRGARLTTAKIPVAITAVDINNADLVVFLSHPDLRVWRDDHRYISDCTFAEAIRASIAIPGIFKPKMFQKMRLVDGGVRANLPVGIIKKMGAGKVVAVNLGYSGYPVPGVDNIVEIAMQSIDLMIYYITKPSLECADLVISPIIKNVHHSDLSKIDYLVKCGYEATCSALPQIKRMLLS